MKVPALNCTLCPRLFNFRKKNNEEWPDWHNAPVNSFGSINSRLLILGLAPGLRGANKTGRPFTGDFAGDLLYRTLSEFNLSSGLFNPSTEDDLKLLDCRITNAVKCVPPQNKPVASEIKNCQKFLRSEIESMKKLRVILALGTVAHNSALDIFGCRKSNHKFAHNSLHHLNDKITLVDSYHCSRYNTNTGRLTEKMFREVFISLMRIMNFN